MAEDLRATTHLIEIKESTGRNPNKWVTLDDLNAFFSTEEQLELGDLKASVGDFNTADFDGRTITELLQTQINNIIATLTVGITFTQATGVTIKDISQAAILAAASISGSQYVIDNTCIGLHLYLIQDSDYEVVPFTAAGTFMKFTKQRINEQDQLDIISLSGLAAERSYIAVIQFKINPKTGI